MLTPRRWAARVAVSAITVAAVMLLAVVLAPRPFAVAGRTLTTAQALRALVDGPPGRPAPDAAAEDVEEDARRVARVIVWRARVPRILLAAVVGAALAQAGAMAELLLRNPLADPFVLGVSSGAALASVLGVALGVSLGGAGHPALAATGALLAALLVQALARDGEARLSVERMVVGGVVLSYLLSAGVMWVVALSSAPEGQRYLFWLMVSVASASGRDVLVAGVALALVSLLGVRVVPALNLTAVGEEHAADSGVAVERVKLATFALCAALTGVAVAVAGSIGFVGLVVPHAVRMLVGTDARLTVPLSAIGGAGFLVVADAVGRAFGEVPLGVVTASCGAPFFLWLLARRGLA